MIKSSTSIPAPSPDLSEMCAVTSSYILFAQPISS